MTQLLALLGLTLSLAGPPVATQNKPAILYAGRPLKAWLDDLSDSDVLIREEAIEVLAQAGTAARRAVAPLKKLLTHKSRTVRTRAALALWKIDGDARHAVTILAASLRESSAGTRREALAALGQMGSEAAPAATAVLELLDDKDLGVRGLASATLQRMGPGAMPAVVATLAAKDVRLRRSAMSMLSGYLSFSLTAEHLPALTARLKDEDLLVRVTAARLLWGLDNTHKAVIAVLLEGVKSPDATLQASVLGTLANGSDKPASIIPILEVGIKATDLSTRIQAARVLYATQKKPDRVLPIYLEAIKGTNRSHWSGAVAGLTELGEEGRSAAPRLIELMKIRDYYHYEVRTALGRMGPTVIPLLVDLLKEPANAVNNYYMSAPESAIAILGTLGTRAATAVVPLLAAKDETMRIRAVRTLALIGPDAKVAVPKLIDLLKNGNARVRYQTTITLGNIGHEAKAAIPKLLELAGGKDAAAKLASLRALAQINPDAKVAVPVCLEALKDPDFSTRLAGLDLLFRVEPDHKEILPQTLECLKKAPLRGSALDLLGRMGPRAAKAVPDIAKLLADSNESIRRSATDALGRIGPAAAQAVPALLEQLKRTDSSTHSATINALRLMDADAKLVVPKLIEFIKTDHGYALPAAIGLLGEYGGKAKTAGPALLRLLADTGQQTSAQATAGLALAQVDPVLARKEGKQHLHRLLRSEPANMTAVRALLLADPNDKEAITALEKGLKSSYYYTRAMACQTVGQLGTGLKKFTPTVKHLLEDRQFYVRGHAAVALWRLTGDANDALPTLQTMLKEKSTPYARAHAAYQLAEMATVAKSAVPALLAARNDPDAFVRSQVELALQKISKKPERK